MAVIAVWKCDRDGAMFADKKKAEEYDKMLELAANISYLIEQNIPSIDEAICEDIGLLLAKHRDNLAKACKGKPESLLDAKTGAQIEKQAGTQVDTNLGKQTSTETTTRDNVAPLVAAATAKK
jgi:hypothetical protein